MILVHAHSGTLEKFDALYQELPASLLISSEAGHLRLVKYLEVVGKSLVPPVPQGFIRFCATPHTSTDCARSSHPLCVHLGYSIHL
jgi:hypothetical protein